MVTRLIVRKERPHPGVQLSFSDLDGLRPTRSGAGDSSLERGLFEQRDRDVSWQLSVPVLIEPTTDRSPQCTTQAHFRTNSPGFEGRSGNCLTGRQLGPVGGDFRDPAP